MFIFSFLIGYSDWQRLYKLPNNAIPVAKGLKLMSFNVRLFNSYNWIDEKNKHIRPNPDLKLVKRVKDLITENKKEFPQCPICLEQIEKKD